MCVLCSFILDTSCVDKNARQSPGGKWPHERQFQIAVIFIVLSVFSGNGSQLQQQIISKAQQSQTFPVSLYMFSAWKRHLPALNLHCWCVYVEALIQPCPAGPRVILIELAAHVTDNLLICMTVIQSNGSTCLKLQLICIMSTYIDLVEFATQCLTCAILNGQSIEAQ